MSRQLSVIGIYVAAIYLLSYLTPTKYPTPILLSMLGVPFLFPKNSLANTEVTKQEDANAQEAISLSKNNLYLLAFLSATPGFILLACNAFFSLNIPAAVIGQVGFVFGLIFGACGGLGVVIYRRRVLFKSRGGSERIFPLDWLYLLTCCLILPLYVPEIGYFASPMAFVAGLVGLLIARSTKTMARTRNKSPSSQ